MMRWLVLVLIGVLAFPAIAAAQIKPTASGTSSSPIQATTEEYWWIIGEMGRCLARSKTQDATAFMVTQIGSVEEGRAFRALINRRHNSCMRNFIRLSFPRAHMRGAIAEGLYWRALGDRTTAPSFRPVDRVGVTSIHNFASCYIVRNGDSAHSLLSESKVGTRKERQMIQQFAPDFAACISEGTTISIDPPQVRLAIAEAAYHATTTSSGLAD